MDVRYSPYALGDTLLPLPVRSFNYNASTLQVTPVSPLGRATMSGQYNFPPPPPPPGPPPGSYGQPQQGPQYGYQTPRGGGGAPRGGRGGNQGRGDFHNPSPYQQNGYGTPQHGQGLPQHGPPQNQGPPVGYDPHNPYIGPIAPGPQGPPQQQNGPQGGYQAPHQPAPQWQNNHQPQPHGPPQHGPPQLGPQQPPPPQPLAPQNYHPNYAPQSYQPQAPQQYGPQQPPQQFQHTQPPQYGAPQSGPPQWQGPQHGQQPFNHRGRGRGGFNNGRGGHEAPLMGPPIRMGFDNSERDHMAQAGNGFPQYQNHHQSSTPVQFNAPSSYPGYQPQGYGGQRPPLDPNPFPSPQRGRGGMNNFRGRGGRGDFQFRGRDGRHQNNGTRVHSDAFQKPAVADAGSNKKKKKRRTNTLGLTPNGADHEESEEEVDDVDEEARLVTLLGPDTPQLPSDLNAWLSERKSRFPTKARREAAAEELQKRREAGKQGKMMKKDATQSKQDNEGESKLEKQQRKAEKLRRELEKAERKIQDAVSGSKRKRENGDEGDEDRDQVNNNQGSGESSDSDSDDSKPEAQSSRSNGPVRTQLPPKAQLQRHCKYFSTGGTCGKKGKCRFVHDQEVRNQALKDKEDNGGKMTLAQRLILNDTAKDDLTILKSIKYLKEKGLMADLANDDEVKNEEDGYENMDY